MKDKKNNNSFPYTVNTWKSVLSNETSIDYHTQNKICHNIPLKYDTFAKSCNLMHEFVKRNILQHGIFVNWTTYLTSENWLETLGNHCLTTKNFNYFCPE